MRGGSKRDLFGSPLSTVLAWWPLIGGMLLAIPLPDGPETVIWVLALSWMNKACVLSAGCIAAKRGNKAGRSVGIVYDLSTAALAGFGGHIKEDAWWPRRRRSR